MAKSKSPAQKDQEVKGSPASELDFTGERIIPGKVDHDLYHEHLVRYLCAQQFCSRKRVLDTGCGVGYGCFHLAKKAHTVVGIDVSHAAVQLALRHYSLPNIKYVTADCCRLPFRAEAFDVVTSFELIEHLQDSKTYLSEVRRVLKRNGHFIVSTPNRPVYAEHREEKSNPFHVREYDLDEFLLLLNEYFRQVQPLGEVHVPAVGVFRYPAGIEITCETLEGGGLDSSDYFVCVCSQRKMSEAESFVLIPSSGNVLRERERHIRSLSAELAERRGYLGRLQKEFDEKAAWVDQLKGESLRLQREFDEKAAWADQLKGESFRLQSELDAQRALTSRQEVDLAEVRKQLDNSQRVIEGLRKTVEEHRQQIETLTWLWQRSTSAKRRLLYALAPLDWIVGFLLTATELLGRSIRKLAPRTPPVWPSADTTRCSLIVPSWEGKELLAESLPAFLKAIERHGGDHELIVVDDGSTDGTEQFVRENFPTVRVVRSPHNICFSGASNLGVRAATRNIVVLLNNDMIVDPGFLAPLLAPFEQPDVFAVASQVFFHDTTKRREETGKTRGYFSGGELVLSHDEILPTDEKLGVIPVLYAGGGAAAFDRRKYLWLGGLDNLYEPFYFEDTDASLRAWKAGWRCLLAVHSHVLHKHRSTNRRYGRDFVESTIRRNMYLFLWKNFSSLTKLWSHCLRIGSLRVRRAGIPGVGMRFEARSYLRAIRRFPLALIHRLDACRSFFRTDDEIFELIAAPPPELVAGGEIDFRKGPFQECLGGGWYELETDRNGGYRWMGLKATAFLRVPGSRETTFAVEGYTPPAVRYGAARLRLTVQIGSESRVFGLGEGEFRHTWHLKGLEPGSIQKVQLAVDQSIQQTTDRRRLAIIVRRLEFNPSPFDCLRSALLSTERRDEAAVEAPVLGRKTKRILFISAFVPAPGIHAGGQRIFRVIQGLSRFHEITLLTFLEEENEKDRLSAVRAYCRDVIPILRPRFPQKYDPWGIEPRWLETEYSCPEMRELVREAAFSGRFDLLQFELLQMSKFLPERSPTPMLLTHHEVQALALERKLRQFPMLSRRRLKLSRLWMQTLRYELTHLTRFTRVILLTTEERTYLRKFSPSLPLVVNPTGVDCSFFQSISADEEPNSIGFVGYFKHEPNVDAAYWLISEIMPKVVRRLPNARLYLVGNEPPDRIEDSFNGLNVIVTGWVPDIRPYLGRCAVFVAPLRLGAGIRGKVLEAWAMERPVVSTSVACAGIRAQNERNLLVADNGDAFADQICRLLGDRAMRERLGRAGLETVRAHYDWDYLIQQHNAIYESI